MPSHPSKHPSPIHNYYKSLLNFLKPLKLELLTLATILFFRYLTPDWLITSLQNLAYHIPSLPQLSPLIDPTTATAITTTLTQATTLIVLSILLTFLLSALALFLFFPLLGLFTAISPLLSSIPTLTEFLNENKRNIAPWVILTIPSAAFMPRYTCAAIAVTALWSAIGRGAGAGVDWKQRWGKSIEKLGVRDFDADDETAERVGRPDGGKVR